MMQKKNNVPALPIELTKQIVEVLVHYVQPQKVILYGSRARGDNSATSDIDIAVVQDSGKSLFRYDIEEEVRTLLKLDIVDLSRVGNALRKEIEKEGIVLYEKI